jgi:hypothetical protein
MSLERAKLPAIFFIREPLASFGVTFQLQVLFPGTQSYLYWHDKHTQDSAHPGQQI